MKKRKKQFHVLSFFPSFFVKKKLEQKNISAFPRRKKSKPIIMLQQEQNNSAFWNVYFDISQLLPMVMEFFPWNRKHVRNIKLSIQALEKKSVS